MGKNTKLSRKMYVAISALLTESSISAAATKAGIGEKTLRRWQKLPIFAEAHKSALRQCFDDAVGYLRAAGIEAVAALRQALTDPSGSVRVRAAVAILEMGMNAGELSDLAARLERLEQTEVDGGPVERGRN